MRERRKGLNRALFWLYEGEGKGPFLFRWSLLIFDFISIAFFMWEPFHSWRGALHESWWVNFDIIIAIYITLDFAARFYIAESKPKFFRKLHNIADVFVVITLVAPVLFENLTFLRILRIIRILRAFTFLRRLKSVSTFIDRHRTVIDRVTNFVVFLFIMSALVYVNQVGRPDSQIHNQLDALYFTVTSLTTTGYGDVLLQGEGGRVLSIVVMLLGLTLFLTFFVMSPVFNKVYDQAWVPLEQEQIEFPEFMERGAQPFRDSASAARRARGRPRVELLPRAGCGLDQCWT